MRCVIASLLLLAAPLPGHAWGEKGHALISRLAIETAGPRLPEFMNASRAELIYNANEPDRWREEAHSPMNLAQQADHFFDSELWGPIPTIDADRYQFMEKVAAKKIELVKIGYLPYAMIENYGRLVNAFRNWRNAKTPADRESSGANAVYIAGVLGHYVGDGSQPMHMTIHHNGWAATVPNPRNFTRDYGIHSRYESAYVNAAIDASKVRPKVHTPQRFQNVWNSIKE